MERWSNTMKFTDAEKTAILAEAHGHLAQWREETRQQRDGDAKFITKTIRNARIPAPAPGDVDKIDAGIRSVLEIAGEAHGRLQRDVEEGFRKRDREIALLRRELGTLRDEVGLERGLSALKSEVAEARRQQPNFEGKLNGLQAEVEKLTKQTTRLRTNQSILDYSQKELAAEQRKNKREISVTVTKLTTFGEQTSEVLRHLCAEAGFDLTGAEYERLN